MDSRFRGNDGRVARDKSRVEIGNQLVLEIRDHVLELELALLEPRQVQLVARGVEREAADRGVEIAMLALELGQLAGDGGRIFGKHAGLGRAFSVTPSPLPVVPAKAGTQRLRRL